MQECTCHLKDPKCVCGYRINLSMEKCFECHRPHEFKRTHASNCPHSMKLKKRKKNRERKNMTNKNLTSINLILDASTSMALTAPAVIKGFNDFISEQKKEPGECVVSLTIFESHSKVIYSAKALSEVPELNKEVYAIQGSTALYDAVGKTIKEVGEKLSKMKSSDRPGKVIFVIFTDGDDNLSRTYTRDQISTMAKHQKDVYSWDFIFIGANIDVEKEAVKLSMPTSLSYDPTMKGTEQVYGSLSRGVSNYRSTGNVNDVFGGAKKSSDVKR